MLIDRWRIALACGPYVMPTEHEGLRIQADTTSGWVPRLPKRVQFSLWDASDPIVDTSRLGFPLGKYLLFSHPLQCYNEPVYQGSGDDDPSGNAFYHHYGIDFGAHESATEVRSVCDGVIHAVPGERPSPGSVGRGTNGSGKRGALRVAGRGSAAFARRAAMSAATPRLPPVPAVSAEACAARGRRRARRG